MLRKSKNMIKFTSMKLKARKLIMRMSRRSKFMMMMSIPSSPNNEAVPLAYFSISILGLAGLLLAISFLTL